MVVEPVTGMRVFSSMNRPLDGSYGSVKMEKTGEAVAKQFVDYYTATSDKKVAVTGEKMAERVKEARSKELPEKVELN
jgi:hypothetical protein